MQWQRVQSDLDAARMVQRSLVPQVMPEISGYELAARSVTCYEVGGDYLDLVSPPSGETIIVVGDVAGKGLASPWWACLFAPHFALWSTPTCRCSKSRPA